MRYIPLEEVGRIENMNVTISTHNGSAAHREHNIRNEKVVSRENHIDPNGEHEIWHDEKPREAYERIFGDAAREYNEKQTREDRKIKDYYSQISKDSKKHPVYEMIIGVYPSDGSLDESVQKEILKEFTEGWQERNPNLELIGAYYHADEQGEPHVHIDYVPVAHGYTRGMETQTGLVKALKEQGFEKVGKLTAQIQWEKSENNHLQKLCEERGLIVEHPSKEKQEHLDTNVYKANKSLESTIDNVKELEDEIDIRRARLNKLDEKIEKGIKLKNKAFSKSYKKEKDKTYTYDRNLLNEVKRLEKEHKEYIRDNNYTQEDIQLEYERTEDLREEAQKTYEEAEKLRNQYKTLKENEVDHIKNLTEIQVNKFIDDEFKHSRGRNRRLEDFCSQIKFNDGTSVLDRFKEQEKALEEELRRKAEIEEIVRKLKMPSHNHSIDDDYDFDR